MDIPTKDDGAGKTLSLEGIPTIPMRASTLGKFSKPPCVHMAQTCSIPLKSQKQRRVRDPLSPTPTWGESMKHAFLVSTYFGRFEDSFRGTSKFS